MNLFVLFWENSRIPKVLSKLSDLYQSFEFTVFIYTVINVLHYMMKSRVNKRDYLQHDAS